MGDVYISVDIETDGPVPGPYSLLSIGMCVAGRFDGITYDRCVDLSLSHYIELQPTGTEIDPEALRINGLDREQLSREGTKPEQAMRDVAEWVETVTEDGVPVLVAYPLSFDWPFLSWYFNRFSDRESPFGHSSCLDIRTLYLAKSRSLFSQSGKSVMPEFLRPTRAHTHNALDDAREQAELFSNIFEWEPRKSPLVA